MSVGLAVVLARHPQTRVSFQDMPAPARVYFSHAPTDSASAEALDSHLSLLKREGLIENWHRRCLQAGSVTKEETERRFDAADVLLIMLSADFIASDECFAELERARVRHEAGTALVRLLLVRPVDLGAVVLRGLPVLPSSGLPISTWPVPEQAFAEVAQVLRRHLAPQAAVDPVSPLPLDDFQYDVFVSYLAKEPVRSWVRRTLVPQLESAGLRVMLDVRDFRLGVPQIEEMERAVQECRRTLAVLTPDYLADGFSALENIMAQHHGRERGEARLVAILREPCTPQLRLRVSPPLEMVDEEQVAEILPRLIAGLRHP